MTVGNAILHLWIKECHTSKFPLEIFIRRFCGVTARLLLAEAMNMENATSRPWIAAIQIQILGLCVYNAIPPTPIAFGRTCHKPLRPLAEGMSYIHVSAGGCNTVLVRSDGHALACGMKLGLCDIPVPEPGKLG